MTESSSSRRSDSAAPEAAQSREPPGSPTPQYVEPPVDSSASGHGQPPNTVPVREWLRVEREPKFLAFDVTAHCGPQAAHVRLETYENEHSYFMSPGEAIRLSEALREVAETTLGPVNYEDAPWLRRPAE